MRDFIDGKSKKEIMDYCEELIGEPIDTNLLNKYEDLDYLFDYNSQTLLIEVDGEQRRKSKLEHYSIEVK